MRTKLFYDMSMLPEKHFRFKPISLIRKERKQANYGAIGK